MVSLGSGRLAKLRCWLKNTRPRVVATGTSMALKKSQKSLKKWTKQKWRTASGKKSSETGEVYAPAKKIKKLKSTAAGRRKLVRRTQRPDGAQQ